MNPTTRLAASGRARSCGRDAPGGAAAPAELQPADRESLRSLRDGGGEPRRGGVCLWLDSRPAPERGRHLTTCAPAASSIERCCVRPKGRDIEVADGLVHHWVGAVFVPEATTAEALRLLQDYDRHAAVYAACGGPIPPAVTRRRQVPVLAAVRHDQGHHRDRRWRARSPLCHGRAGARAGGLECRSTRLAK